MQLMPTPAPGFDNPLGLLRACHERILDHCVTLERLAPHLQLRGADQDARLAAARILRYFRLAGPHHHADEEESLFPALRHHSAFTDSQRALLDELAAQHREMAHAWAQLEAALEAISKGMPASVEALVEPFVALYRAHIHLENTEVLSAAAHCLDAAALAELSQAMEARRQS